MSEPNEPILRPDSAGSSAGEPKKEDTAGWAGDLFTWLQALTFALVIIMIGYEPRQGDVVVLHKSFSTTGEPIVKRVIAVGGQSVHIDYDTSTVYVDGEPVDDSYLGEPMVQPGSSTTQGTDWDIPEGSVFVMGDNRNNSSDSREESLGPVENQYVLGRALVVLFPFSHFGSIH